MTAPIRQISLRFAASGDTDMIANLSASVRIGASLFLGADEACSIERLTVAGDKADQHQRYALKDLLDLKDPDEEADIEGLAVCDDWLWVVGSHARTRPNPARQDDGIIDLDKLANLRDTRPRCLLARLPLVRDGKGWKPVKADDGRRAGLVRQGKHGNDLAKALRKDSLLAPFARVPAKEGGIDVEGVAVCGDRIALGLRGPVISTFAMLLEVVVEPKRSGRLALCGAVAKRLLDLGGLGIRDLKRRGDDLLILAGPTTGLDGPCALYIWRDWVNDPVQDVRKVRVHRPERVFDLPFGAACDHPEGLAVWNDSGSEILVVCDSPSADRLSSHRRTIRADLVTLPD